MYVLISGLPSREQQIYVNNGMGLPSYLYTIILMLSSPEGTVFQQCCLVMYSSRATSDDIKPHQTTPQENCSQVKRQKYPQYITSHSGIRVKKPFKFNIIIIITKLSKFPMMTANDKQCHLFLTKSLHWFIIRLGLLIG